MTTPTPNCPQCGKKLERVERGPNSMLNADQFDAIRAGDWLCRSCLPNGRSTTQACYFWEREL